MLEGNTKIGDAAICVQDEQVMIYFPGGEGTSEPITGNTIERLEFVAQVAKIHAEQVERKKRLRQLRVFETSNGGRGLREWLRRA